MKEIKCDIKTCKEAACYGYEWKQSGKKHHIELCKYCNWQLMGEMLKQMAIEKMGWSE